jgi:hypothetical protein
MNSTTTTTSSFSSSVFDDIYNPIQYPSSSSSSIFLPIVPLKNVKNRNELTINHEVLSNFSSSYPYDPIIFYCPNGINCIDCLLDNMFLPSDLLSFVK